MSKFVSGFLEKLGCLYDGVVHDRDDDGHKKINIMLAKDTPGCLSASHRLQGTWKELKNLLSVSGKNRIDFDPRGRKEEMTAGEKLFRYVKQMNWYVPATNPKATRAEVVDQRFRGHQAFQRFRGELSRTYNLAEFTPLFPLFPLY